MHYRPLCFKFLSQLECFNFLTAFSFSSSSPWHLSKTDGCNWVRVHARPGVLPIERHLINVEGARKISNFELCGSANTVPEEEEVDYLNETQDHDHWIIT